MMVGDAGDIQPHPQYGRTLFIAIRVAPPECYPAFALSRRLNKGDALLLARLPPRFTSCFEQRHNH